MSQRQSQIVVHEGYMALALREGIAGLGTTSPNPSVGAVIVARGRVIGRGRTQPPGQAHAEIMALRQAGARARGADLYCTLEPCNHTGRTAPCTEAIVGAGIARVFYGAVDVNPTVKGGGGARLRRAGVEVQGGVSREDCERLHAAFFKHVSTGLPRVTLKMAATLDGRIAADSGHSQWITGSQAREWVHHLRSQVDAVMVGAGTVRQDDPQLTARDVGAHRQPTRIIVEGRTPLPLDRQVFHDRTAPTLLATPHVSARRRRALETMGVTLVEMASRRAAEVDLARLLRELGRRGMMHLLCEGGRGLGSALIHSQLVDRLELFLAPKLLGSGPSWLTGPSTRSMAEALQLGEMEVERLGADLHIGVELSGRRA